MEGSRIADSVKGCLELFRALASLDPPSPALTASYQTALMAIADDESRLKVWFANMDVRASENRSLRFRLRKASPLRDHVLRFLNDLSKFLEGALVIMKEGVVPWDEDEDEDEDDDFLNGGPDSLEDDGDNDEPPKSEMEQIADCISEFVDCIPQMSNSPRNPAPRDCSAASVPTDAPYESFDIQHVQAKFQKVDKILAQRLGSAITIRRQFFKYRESLKLAHGLDPKDQADGESTIANSIPSHAQSTEFDHTSLATHEDSVWDTDTCQASLTSSLADTDLLCIPPLPKGAESGHFECPFCFMTITATDIASWKRHVLADLRPYTCLSADCPVGKRFATSYEWILHEIEYHWKYYVCPLSCGENFQSRFEFAEHVHNNHPSNMPEHRLEAMISLNSRQIRVEDGIPCPMCHESLDSVPKYQLHVGGHQEQLAMFALPAMQPQGDDDGDDNDGDDNDVNGLGNDVDGLDNNVEGLDNDVDGLAEDADGLDNNVDGLENDVNGLDNNADGLGNDVEHEHVGKREVDNIQSHKASGFTKIITDSSYTSSHSSMTTFKCDSRSITFCTSTAEFKNNKVGKDSVIIFGDISGPAGAELLKGIWN